MTESQGARLIELAQDAIAHSLGHAPSPVLPTDSQFTVANPVFVTLRINSRLRGCMGSLGTKAPLVDTVQECALAAAFRDPRFAPVAAEEVEQLEIEISLLSSFRVVEGPHDIRIGSDGLLIEKGEAHGILLPKVATEFQADADEFLKMVCRKAKLPENAWREALVKAFTVQAFSHSPVP